MKKNIKRVLKRSKGLVWSNDNKRNWPEKRSIQNYYLYVVLYNIHCSRV